VATQENKSGAADYHACVIVRSASESKRALEILVRGSDLYAVQPRKGASIKTSYHESGVFHVKLGKKLVISSSRPHIPTQVLLEDASTVGPFRERVYSKSLENFAKLLDVKSGADYDEIAEFEIDDREGLFVIELDVTNYHHPEGDWQDQGVTGKVLSETTLLRSGFSFVARFRHLSPVP
jgi:hypothetical protein